MYCRFNFSTADSSNSVQICQSVGLYDVVRLETSTRYLITFKKSKSISKNLYEDLAAPLHDRMTQCIYTKENLPRQSFNEGLPRDLEPWFVVPLQAEGMVAMEKVNKKLGNILFIVHYKQREFIKTIIFYNYILDLAKVHLHQ